MQVLKASDKIISQIIDLCKKLSPSQYSNPVRLFLNNSIGKHVRHIIEFYDILMCSSLGDRVLSYDCREHCERTEREVNIALQRLNKIEKWLKKTDKDIPMKLVVSYDSINQESFEIDSSLQRELVYNLEHAIHHMAIIRIVIENEFPDIQLNKHFGIAFSTIRFRDDLCAH